jgi:hypothetical protein
MQEPRQLDLLDQFDKGIKRDERLVNELLAALQNFKYFRINTRFSDVGHKQEIDGILGQILYWVAFLAFKKARFIPAHKASTLDSFLKLTKEAEDLSVTEYLTPDTLSQYYQNGHRRLKTTFMIYKDLLVDERTITKRLLDNFDSIHNITHAIQSTEE